MIKLGYFYRTIDPLFWVKKTFDAIDKAELERSDYGYKDSEELKFVISDVRFKNEANYVHSKEGKLIRLERDPSLNIYKEPINDSSETELDNYDKFLTVFPPEDNKVLKDLELIAQGLNLKAETWKHSKSSV